MSKQVDTFVGRAVLVAAVMVALTACGSPDRTPTRAESAAEPETTSAPALDPAPPPTSDGSGGGSVDVPVGGSLDVSGDGVGGVAFGTGADETRAALTEALGDPDLTLGPSRYSRIPGADGWYERAGDEISPSWRYRVASVSCWGRFCAIFGGGREGSLRLRGWELADHNRWDDSGTSGAGAEPDVRLVDTGITLGDSWETLQAAYPGTVAEGAEGASLGVGNTPWPAIFDGAAGWRLSGAWDYEHPTKVPAGAVVTRLSGGEGPEPGCC